MTPPGPDPILIAGPTGVGKSSFAVALAQQVGGEIICADAFQIYRGMAILTAQPTREQRMAVSHYLYGELAPDEPCDVNRWLEMVNSKVRAIQSRGRHPLLVGGTGLYFKAFTHGLDPLPATDPDLRRELSEIPLADQTERLRSLDPSSLHHLDVRNPRRVQRALEIVLTTGRPLAESRRRWQGEAQRSFHGFLLRRERRVLHERIEHNVQAMLTGGAVDEVRAILDHVPASSGRFTAGQAIGFQEIAAWLRGEIDLETCRETILRQTRAYAKRQETWFRREKDWQVLAADAEGEFPLGNLSGHLSAVP